MGVLYGEDRLSGGQVRATWAWEMRLNPAS